MPTKAGCRSSLTPVALFCASPQVFDLGNHYLQSSSQKLLTGGAAGAGALTLGTTAGPLTTMEIKVGAHIKGML